MCRHCKWYRPNEQYRGVIGYCDKYGRPVGVNEVCSDEQQGEQRWMNGEPVVEKEQAIDTDKLLGLMLASIEEIEKACAECANLKWAVCKLIDERSK